MSPVPVGTFVQYTDHEGMTKAALVIMNTDTYDPERDLDGVRKPDADTSLGLLVFRAGSGHTYARHNVPLEGSPEHAALVAAKAEYDATLAEKADALPEGVTMEDLAESAEEAGDEWPAPQFKAPKVTYWTPVA
jgi:hypothetical protein